MVSLEIDPRASRRLQGEAVNTNVQLGRERHFDAWRGEGVSRVFVKDSNGPVLRSRSQVLAVRADDGARYVAGVPFERGLKEVGLRDSWLRIVSLSALGRRRRLHNVRHQL